jgi:hypothetical protein
MTNDTDHQARFRGRAHPEARHFIDYYTTLL